MRARYARHARSSLKRRGRASAPSTLFRFYGQSLLFSHLLDFMVRASFSLFFLKKKKRKQTASRSPPDRSSVVFPPHREHTYLDRSRPPARPPGGVVDLLPSGESPRVLFGAFRFYGSSSFCLYFEKKKRKKKKPTSPVARALARCFFFNDGRRRFFILLPHTAQVSLARDSVVVGCTH